METSTEQPGEATSAVRPNGRATRAIASSHSPVRHLNQIELSRRWSISPRTLERWRWIGQGPRFLKVGGRVIYRLLDIEAFEAEQLRTSTLPSEQAIGGAR